MQDWDCTVRMPSNYLQHIVVEAYNYNDARTIAESSTGGKLLNATPKYTSSNDAESDSSSNGGGILFVLLVVFLIAAWKYILLFGGIALILWFMWTNWNK